MTSKEQTIRTTRLTVQQCRWADLTRQTFTAYVEARTIRTTGRRLMWWHLPNRYRTEYRVVCDRTGQDIDPGMLTHESQLRVRDAMMRERAEVARWVQEYREIKEAELKASLVLSEAVASTAARALDNFLATVRENTGVDIAQLYSMTASFEPVARLWHRACDPILRTAEATDGDINMSDHPECREAMAALQAKLYDAATYNRAGAVAVKLNIPGAEHVEMDPEHDPFVLDVYNGMKARNEGHAPRKEGQDTQDQRDTQDQTQQQKTTMRGTYYEARVQYMGPKDNIIKKVTEKFIVEADTMTEVETVITEQLTLNEQYATPRLLACTATKVIEIWDIVGEPDGADVFKATIDYIEIKDNGKERRISTQYIIRAADIDEASKEATRRIRAFGPGYELRSMQNVSIADIFERKGTGK